MRESASALLANVRFLTGVRMTMISEAVFVGKTTTANIARVFFHVFVGAAFMVVQKRFGAKSFIALIAGVWEFSRVFPTMLLKSVSTNCNIIALVAFVLQPKLFTTISGHFCIIFNRSTIVFTFYVFYNTASSFQLLCAIRAAVPVAIILRSFFCFKSVRKRGHNDFSRPYQYFKLEQFLRTSSLLRYHVIFL